ncbi:MAG: hypothetical protein JNK82_08810 [Myxococcaceae bacterium]|nr:hypothetical protein [Myxococcaceae bacterium]
MRRASLLTVVALSACSAPVIPDAGVVDSGLQAVDSGPPPPSCDSAEDCAAAGFPGVCRAGVCRQNVPCSDDLECGIGEACANRTCRFVGCTRDEDCPTGACRMNSFTCVECGADSDCPFNKPRCRQSTQTCVECVDDSSCPTPGASYCDTASATCKHCLVDQHCPNSLRCMGNTCVGVGVNGQCPPGTACGAGLTCVNVNNNGTPTPTCLTSCNVYQPQCAQGEICYALKYSNGNSFVFDLGGLLGVCFQAGAGKNYRDSCDYNWLTGGTCKAQFMCIPDSALTSTCRAFCDPGQTNACPAPEICHPFPGDFNGRQFGICYNDTGWGDRCTNDARCRPNQSCQPWDDPSTNDFLATDTGTFCQYSVGTKPGLEPCANTVLPDAGVLTADKSCKSGTCRTDGTTGLPPYYCWSACESDVDCNIGARTGTCDTRYPFNAPAGVAQLYGCRPGCDSHASCGEYGPDAGLACTLRLSTLTRNSGLKLECGRSPDAGFGGPGASCTLGSQCRSGMCSVDDARAVRRLGYCLEACRTAAECAPENDGGLASGPLDCQPNVYLGSRGPDFVANTPDDVLSVKRVCSGIACNEDEDCSTDGGARCVPDVSPFDAGAYVLRCRPPSQFGTREGGVPCIANTDCRSGACGRLTADGGQACYRACDTATGLCPAGLSCQPNAYRFTSTGGSPVLLDGCAP